MRFRLKTRTLLIWLAIFAALLAAIDRAWNSHWASYYWKHYWMFNQRVSVGRQYEGTLRAAGKVQEADAASAKTDEFARQRDVTFWHWLRALALDEP
jgi:hypothetical protein